nr:serine/threonine-protein kinase PknH/PknJ [Mycobacterium simiae]
MLRVGSVFAGYRIERLLGAGGMGTVYLARNPDLPRSEALKVLAPELSLDPDFRARFVREADVAAGLDHPNIVSVYQRGQFEGQLWIAMQFVDGGNAEDALRSATMTAARAVYVVGEVAKALEYAHRRGVVHRDIKPANFLLSGQAGCDERVLLGDFGIARALGDSGLTSTGSVLATLAYAAPEVLAGQRFDNRADLYSLGCTLFRLLTGETPFSAGDAAAAVVAAHLHQPPPKVSDRAPGLSAAMDAVIATAMAKDPAQRFPSARELAHAAAAALHQRSIVGWAQLSPAPHDKSPPAEPELPWWQHPVGPATVMAPPAPTPSRRRRWVVAAAAVAVAAVILTMTLTSHSPNAPSRSATALAPTATTTTRSWPPIVTPAGLPGLLPPLDDVKNFTGVQELVAQPPSFQPAKTVSYPVDREECAPLFGGGAYNSYDMRAVVGYYSLFSEDPRNEPSLQQVGQVVLAFPDAAAAQRQLVESLSTWHRCGGSTLTLLAHNGLKPVTVSTSVPDIGDNGITTMVLRVQGPALRARNDRAIAAKNNVLVDVDVILVNTDRGQQAVLDITNYVLGRIPG